MLNRTRCAAKNKNGGPCHAAATETGFCYIHSESGRAAEIGREGGRRNRRFVPSELPPLPRLDTSDGVRDAIGLIIGEAYKGNQNAKRMLAFAPLFTTLHRVVKVAELEERLKKLESLAAKQGKAEHSEGEDGQSRPIA
jgi:hypothetical protein